MRKSQTFVADFGRDKGKNFLITEFDTFTVSKFVDRIFFEMMNAGIEIPEDVQDMGIAGLLMVGMESLKKIPYERAEPLLDKLMECVVYVPELNVPTITRGPNGTAGKFLETDIEEFVTVMKLRKAVYDLHTDFLRAADQ